MFVSRKDTFIKIQQTWTSWKTPPMAWFKVIYYVYVCEVRGGMTEGRLQQATGLFVWGKTTIEL